MNPRQTHTFAELELSQEAYDEIREKLVVANYQHAFAEGGAIDMHSIGVTAAPPNLGCTLPPVGWYCSREPGHDGPCAAREVWTPTQLAPTPAAAPTHVATCRHSAAWRRPCTCGAGARPEPPQSLLTEHEWRALSTHDSACHSGVDAAMEESRAALNETAVGLLRRLAAPGWCNCGKGPLHRPGEIPWCKPGTIRYDEDQVALDAAREIALMWGNDRGHFVSKIQVRVLAAMRRALAESPVPAGEGPCPRCLWFDCACPRTAAPGPSVDDGLDFEPNEHHNVADMANVGYSLMQALKHEYPSYHYNNSPAEVVGDLLNQVEEAKLAREPHVPAALPVVVTQSDHAERYGYTRGWNDCREAALAAAPAATPSAPPGAAPSQVECHGLDTPDMVRFYERDFYPLSNFSAFKINHWGLPFDTSEAAYHWLKFADTAPVVADEIWRAPSAHEAFKIAERNKDQRRPDWDAIKLNVMRGILRSKVEQHEYVRRKLLATGDRLLVEDSWRDDYWGWGPNRDGQNWLGKLWMELRAALAGAASRDGER